jgi:hypothetical protein
LEVYATAASLHFGTFGGETVKLIYGLLGLALTVISAGGVSIWLIRRRDQARALPRIEKAWAGIVWGAPVSIAIAAIATQALKTSPSPVFWVAWLILTGGALALKNGEVASRCLRFGLVLALLAMTATDMLVFGGAAGSGFALWVNIVLALAAVTIGVPLLKESSAPRGEAFGSA